MNARAPDRVSSAHSTLSLPENPAARTRAAAIARGAPPRMLAPGTGRGPSKTARRSLARRAHRGRGGRASVARSARGQRAAPTMRVRRGGRRGTDARWSARGGARRQVHGGPHAAGGDAHAADATHRARRAIRDARFRRARWARARRASARTAPGPTRTLRVALARGRADFYRRLARSRPFDRFVAADVFSSAIALDGEDESPQVAGAFDRSGARLPNRLKEGAAERNLWRVSTRPESIRDLVSGRRGPRSGQPSRERTPGEANGGRSAGGPLALVLTRSPKSPPRPRCDRTPRRVPAA